MEEISGLKDNRLPGNHALKAMPGRTNDWNRQVSRLVNWGDNSWNVHNIQRSFHPHDATITPQFKPPDASKKDSLAWHYEKNGVFLVGSAYKLAYYRHYNQQTNPGTN